jgi:hypothetical protein
MKRRSNKYLLLLPFLFFACDTFRSPKQVLEHHLAVFATADLDALIDDYHKDAKIFYGHQIIEGHIEIREFFKNFIRNELPPGSKITMNDIRYRGDLVYIHWSGTGKNKNFKLGSDTFIIQDGLIQTQTIAIYAEDK